MHGCHRRLLGAMERARQARPGLTVEDDCISSSVWDGLEGAPQGMD